MPPVQSAEEAAPFVREIAHTADAGFEVEAPTEAACLERAVLALASLIAGTETIEPRTHHRLHGAGEDAGARLQALLHAVLLLAQVEGFLVSAAEVTVLDERTAEAVVAGEPYDPARHQLHGEIKAITWHGLALDPTPRGWRARVIVDV